jgi:uncharacterized coiled-coil protein SlyX
MAESDNQPVNAGEQITDTSTNLALSPEAQFRNVNKRLEELAKAMASVEKPPVFRIADIISLLVIVSGLAAAVFTALGLSQRISDLNINQGQAEQRISAGISATELRVQSKIDKLSDQFTSMNERLSHIEGADAAKASKPHN